MRNSRKPVRKCHACLLNQGDHCWLYAAPRGQWRNGRNCKAYENEEVYRQFREWCKLPTVKTRRELRCEAFRSRKRVYVPRTKAQKKQ